MQPLASVIRHEPSPGSHHAQRYPTPHRNHAISDLARQHRRHCYLGRILLQPVHGRPGRAHAGCCDRGFLRVRHAELVEANGSWLSHADGGKAWPVKPMSTIETSASYEALDARGRPYLRAPMWIHELPDPKTRCR